MSVNMKLPRSPKILFFMKSKKEQINFEYIITPFTYHVIHGITLMTSNYGCVDANQYTTKWQTMTYISLFEE